ncbi:MAG: UDP-N-acetylmuramoyl-tripeptide--D-alanyl-D-alanine ligase [Spirochaetaceae bacterium]|nr:UDP-N-acetylmuramoyl-tripeptide--D-alanyl-D-alanine ligase [Spirochaetaceae bacterium]
MKNLIDIQTFQNSLLNFTTFLTAISGNLLCSPKSDFCFTHVSCDSRNITEGSLFFPLVGEKQDGHKYIYEAERKGASVICIEKSFILNHRHEILSYFSDKNVFVVETENNLRALQKTAAAYVDKFPHLVRIGITGSSGKTTTKELAVSVFKEKYSVVATVGNFNSETGLPLSVFQITKDHQIGIFEMGMNRFDEIGELADVLRPHYGIITNIGTAHIGILGSKKNIALEKAKIFKHFSDGHIGFVPETSEFFEYISTNSLGKIKGFSLCNQNIFSHVCDKGLKGFSFKIGDTQVNFPLFGRYNLENALSVASLAKEIGLSDEEIGRGLEKVTPLFGRGEVLTGSFDIIQDCYNANAESMHSSLDFLQNFSGKGKKYFVIGDMLELGEDSQKIHKELIDSIDCSKIAGGIFFGAEMAEAAKKTSFDANILSFSLIKNTDDSAILSCFNFLKEKLQKGDVVLVKGSRGIHLERLTEKLMALQEETAL